MQMLPMGKPGTTSADRQSVCRHYSLTLPSRPKPYSHCHTTRTRTPCTACSSHKQQQQGTTKHYRSVSRSDQNRRTVLLSSFAPLLFLPDIGKALQGEVSLWQQEVQLYSRQLQDKLGLTPPPKPEILKRPRLNPAFAQLLLDVPLQAVEDLQGEAAIPPIDRNRYDLEFKRLKARELPYLEDAGVCGSCGEQGLSDAAWFDALSYFQFKTLASQLTPPAVNRYQSDSSLGSVYDFMHRDSIGLMAFEGRAELTDEEDSQVAQAQPAKLPLPIKFVKQRVGELVLSWLETNALTADEQAVVALRTPQLDVIRAGTKSLLRAMQSLGFMSFQGLAFFGASKFEDRNHEVWVSGEPAFVKIWLDTPATLRSAQALQAEEGFSQDFVYHVLDAYLTRCGVSATTFRRFPSITQPQLVAEQFTIKSTVPTTEQPTQEEAALLAKLPPFSLDVCPGPDALACY